jgi:hypothetical protein
MSALLTTDYLAAEALTICQAAGRPNLKVRVTDTRYESGRHEYYLLVEEDGDFGRQPVSYAVAWGAEAVLRELAHKLGCSWPIPTEVLTATATPYKVVGSAEVITATQAQLIQYATASQKEEIIRLLNHPLITRQEKTKMLLNINRLDEERATQAIAKLRTAIEDRQGTSAVAA